MSRYVLSVIVLLLACGAAHADLVNLVMNGEFEDPTVVFFEAKPNGSVPGWIAAGGTIELWQQGAAGEPTTGSDASGTGQHLEVNYLAADTITQTVVTPPLLTPSVVLSFDAWLRDVDEGSALGSTYSVEGSTSGPLVAGAIVMNTTTWTLNTSLPFDPVVGEMLTVEFIGLGDGNDSAHIDQVVLLANAVPEARSWLMLGVVAIGASAISVARRFRLGCFTVR